MYAKSAVDKDLDDSSSQERIIGITKTVDIQVTSLEEEGRRKTTADKEYFRGMSSV
jgi:hypothetical protein